MTHQYFVQWIFPLISHFYWNENEKFIKYMYIQVFHSANSLSLRWPMAHKLYNHITDLKQEAKFHYFIYLRNMLTKKSMFYCFFLLWIRSARSLSVCLLLVLFQVNTRYWCCLANIVFPWLETFVHLLKYSVDRIKLHSVPEIGYNEIEQEKCS